MGRLMYWQVVRQVEGRLAGSFEGKWTSGLLGMWQAIGQRGRQADWLAADWQAGWQAGGQVGG